MTSPDTQTHTQQHSPELELSIWQRLTKPDDHITEPGERRQVQLLTSTLLIVTPLTIIGAIASLIVGALRGSISPGIITTGGASVVLAVAYFLGRSRHYRAGAILTVAILGFVPFGSIVSQGSAHMTEGILWAALPLILSSILLPFSGTIMLLFSDLAAVLVLPLIMPGLPYQDILRPLGYILVIGGLVAVSRRHRDAIEGDRQETIQRSYRELESVQRTLEDQVVERTRELEQRSAYLEASGAIARETARTVDPQQILPLVTNLISEHYGFYDTSIYLTDTADRYLVLRAASSEGGQQMLARGHQLGLNETTLTSRAATTAQFRVSLDIEPDTADLRYPDLPDTRSVLALPLRVQDRVIGVIQIHSTDSQAFEADEIGILESLADQVALSLENARLLDESMRTVEALESAYGETTRASWQSLDTLPAFEYDRVGTSPVRIDLDSVTREAISSGKAVTISEPEKNRSALITPLRLRGEQIIGAITLEERTGVRPWTAEEIELVETVSSQVALALESARLFEESQRRLQEQSRLFSASLQLAGAPLEVEGIAQIISEQFARVIEVNQCSLSLLDSAGQILQVAAEVEINEQGEAAFDSTDQEAYPLRQYRDTASVLQTLRPLVIHASQPDIDPAELEYLRARGKETALIVPLALKGRALGVIEIEADQERTFSSEELNLALTLANQAAVTLDNARLFDQIQVALNETEEQARRLALLNEMGEQLSRAATLDEGLAAGLSTACQVFAAQRASVALLDEDSETYTVAALHGEEGETPMGIRLPLEDSAIEVAAKERRLVTIHSTDSGDLGNIHSYMIAPLTVGQQVIGTLNVGSQIPDAFTQRDEGLAIQVASVLSATIENSRLFEEARTRAEEMAVLNDLARTLTSQLNVKEVLEQTYQGASRLLDTTNFYVALHDQNKQSISFPLAVENNEPSSWRSRPMGNGMTEHIIRTQEPILIMDGISDWLEEHGVEQILIGDESPAQSWLGVPMIVGAQLLGVMTVQSVTEPNVYGEHERELLTAIATQAAIALQNARLFEEANARADEMAVLNELARALATRLDLVKVLEEAYQGASRLVDTTNFSIALYDQSAGTVEFPLAIESNLRNSYPSRPLRQGLTEYIIHTRAPILLKDGVSRWIEENEIETVLVGDGKPALSWLGVPLLIGDQVLGVMTVQSVTAPNVYDERDLSLLSAIANQTAIALQNSRLFGETQAALAETESLYRASRAVGEATSTIELEQALVDYVSLSGVDAIRVLTFQRDDQGTLTDIVMRAGWRADGQPAQPYGTTLPMSEYPLAEFMNPAEPIVINDVLSDERANQATRSLLADESGIRSAIFVPITAGDRWIGMMFIGRKEPSVFRDERILGYETLAGQAAVAFERIRLFEETQRRAAQLQAAAEVARDAAAILDVDQLLDETVHLISEQFGFYHAGVFLVDDNREYANLRAASSEGGRRMLDRGHKLRIGQVGIVGYVADRNEPRIALDVGADAVYFDNPDMPDTRSELGLPLTYRGEVIGVLDVQSRQANAFSQEDVASLQTMADQLATAIQNARLFSESQDLLRETRELFEASQAIGAASTPTEVTQALLDYVSHTELDVARALFYDFTGQDPTHIIMAEDWSIDNRPLHPYGTRLPTGDFALTRFIHPTEAVTVENIHADPRVDESVRMVMEVIRLRSFAVIPLTAGRRPIGGFMVGRDTPYAFPEKVVRNLWTLCGQAAIAIEGLRLLDETRRRAQELEAINEMSRTLTSVLDPSILLRQIADVTKAQFGHDFVSIFLVEGDQVVLEDSSTIGDSDKRLGRRSAMFQIQQPGLVTDAVRTGLPVMVNDVLGDPRFTTVPELASTRSELVVPIEVKGNIIGALDVHNARPSAYDQTDTLLLQALASQAGVAIENARLFSDAERTAWREQAAREIMARVQGATDVEGILQVAVRGLGQALNAPRALVQLGAHAPGDGNPEEQPPTGAPSRS